MPEVLQAVQAAAMTDAPRFPLIAAAEAQRALEAGETVGAPLLVI